MKHSDRSQLSLSIFFPAYNEEENIETIVSEADRVAREITDTYEIIVVNDGSKDATGKIAEDIAKKNPHVRVVHHDPNRGYGAAVWSGIRAAKHQYVFFTDADLQFDMRELKKLARHASNYDMVMGYREKRNDPLIRTINAKSWNILNRILFGLRVRDIDCAFKLFKKDLVADLPIRSRGAMMSAEMLIRLQRKNVEFKEVPVRHFPRVRGTQTGANPKVIARAFKEMLQLYIGGLGKRVQLQLLMFAAVGAVNTTVDVGLYFALTRTLGFFAANILLAKALTFLFGAATSFYLNRRWTFAKRNPTHLREIVRFYATVGAGMGINVGALYVVTHIMGLSDIIGVVIATGATFMWNFILSKFWVFADSRPAILSVGRPGSLGAQK